MPLQFSFADFMTVFAILGALGMIPIADTYRSYLADHIYRYRRLQRYKSKKDPWSSFGAFYLTLTLFIFAAYAIGRRQVPSLHKLLLYFLLRAVTILLSVTLMFPLLTSWAYMDRVFLNYPYLQIRRRHIKQRIDNVFTRLFTAYLVGVVLLTMALTAIHIFAPALPLSVVYCTIVLLLGFYDLTWILGPIILAKRYLEIRNQLRRKNRVNTASGGLQWTSLGANEAAPSQESPGP